MRVFPLLLAALAVVLLYFIVLDRETLTAAFAPPASEEVAADAAPAKPEAEADTSGVRVSVLRSRAQDLDNAILLRGQTEALRQVDVSAETTAQVISEPLRKGTWVEAGAVLCRLAPGTRKARLAEAEARLAEARARAPEAEARLAEAEARLSEARINDNAARKLSEGGFASQTRVAGAEAAVKSAEAAVEAARGGLESTGAGIQSAEAAVAAAETEIARLTLTAPFSGLLETDTAELGSLLQAQGGNARCATIIQLDPIKLVAFVPETEVNRVELGAPVLAELAAGGTRLQGRVRFLSRAADPTTRTFRVEIDVANPGLTIRDGQTAEIAISTKSAQAHLIPQSALTLDDRGRLGLRTVTWENTAEFVPVTLLRDSTEGVWVTGPTPRADIIVVGQDYVTDGAPVVPVYRDAGTGAEQ